jgi:hypothetical protein
LPVQQSESDAPAAKPPKEKKPPRDKKPQGERKPPREKKPTDADPTPAPTGGPTEEASGDAWGAEDGYDPWAVPAENPEQGTPAPKPHREKRKPPRERRPPADNKSAGETASTGDAPASPAVETPISPTQGDASNEKKKTQAYHNPERVLTGGAQRVS